MRLGGCLRATGYLPGSAQAPTTAAKCSRGSLSGRLGGSRSDARSSLGVTGRADRDEAAHEQQERSHVDGE